MTLTRTAVTTLAGIALVGATLTGIDRAMDRQDQAHKTQLGGATACWTEFNAEMAPEYVEGLCGTPEGIQNSPNFIHWGLPQDGEQAGDYN